MHAYQELRASPNGERYRSMHLNPMMWPQGRETGISASADESLAWPRPAEEKGSRQMEHSLSSLAGRTI